MEYPEYLYHYTSIETLELILKYKTIRFKSLIQVDDMDEAKTKDLGNFGKYCYVGCWTEGEKESIPLWDMYSSNMKGVRLKLPAFPFVKYYYFLGEYHFCENCESYIDYKKIYDDSKVTVLANNPKLIKMEYTDNEELIYPKVNSIDNDSKTHNIRTNIIGKYKGTVWEFQREWRYIIFFNPFSEKELFNEMLKIFNSNISNEQRDVLVPELFESKMKKILNPNTLIPYDYFDLNIKPEIVDNIEIMIGPKTTLEEKEKVRTIAKEYCKNAVVNESNLKIQ